MRTSLDTIQAARTPTVHDRAVDAGPIGAVCTSRFGTKCHCIGESYAFLRHVVRYLAQDGVGAASEVDLGWHGSEPLPCCSIAALSADAIPSLIGRPCVVLRCVVKRRAVTSCGERW